VFLKSTRAFGDLAFDLIADDFLDARARRLHRGGRPFGVLQILLRDCNLRRVRGIPVGCGRRRLFDAHASAIDDDGDLLAVLLRLYAHAVAVDVDICFARLRGRRPRCLGGSFGRQRRMRRRDPDALRSHRDDDVDAIARVTLVNHNSRRALEDQ
jgi:hypothetical protein